MFVSARKPMISVQVHGLSELVERMRELEPKLARSALRAAGNAGAQIIKKEAQALAPEDTGKLKKKAIYVVRSRSESSASKVTFSIGVRLGRKEAQKGRDAFYWWYLEFGTRFMAAQPFIRPAFQRKWKEAVEAARLKLFTRLEQLTAGNK